MTSRAARHPRPHSSDLGRLDDNCPYCDGPLAKRPIRKTVCPHCGNAIFVRMRPLDRKRVLLTGADAAKIEEEWSALQIWSMRTRTKTGERE